MFIGKFLRPGGQQRAGKGNAPEKISFKKSARL
jgi:hypothetical protein